MSEPQITFKVNAIELKIRSQDNKILYPIKKLKEDEQQCQNTFT